MSEEGEKPELKVLTKSLLDVAVESWRFGKAIRSTSAENWMRGNKTGTGDSFVGSRENWKTRSRTQGCGS